MAKTYREMTSSEIPAAGVMSLRVLDANGHEYDPAVLPVDNAPRMYRLTIVEEDPDPEHHQDQERPPEHPSDTPSPQFLTRQPHARRNSLRAMTIEHPHPAPHRHPAHTRPQLTPRLERIVQRASSRGGLKTQHAVPGFAPRYPMPHQMQASYKMPGATMPGWQPAGPRPFRPGFAAMAQSFGGRAASGLSAGAASGPR